MMPKSMATIVPSASTKRLPWWPWQLMHCDEGIVRVERLDRTDQRGSRDRRRMGDGAQTEMHPVGEVDVRAAGLFEHRRVAGRLAAVRVRAGVVVVTVRLRLHDPADGTSVVGVVDDQAADQVSRHDEGGSSEERANQQAERKFRTVRRRRGVAAQRDRFFATNASSCFSVFAFSTSAFVAHPRCAVATP